MNGRITARQQISRLGVICLMMGSPLGTSALATTTGSIQVASPSSFRPTDLSARQISTSSTLPGGDLAFNPATMMRVSDLRPGMKGFGLTVFSGVRPERFEAEIVGVRHKSMMAGQDIILCRLTHPWLEGIGVVGGMSGSPVYMDGKLIGAVGYGWPTDKVPLAGVTPVEDMLKVLNSTRAPEVTPDGPGSLPLGGAPSATAYATWLEVLKTNSLKPLESWASLRAPSLTPIPSTEFSGLLGPSTPQGDMVPLSSPFHLSSASPMTRQLMPLLFPGRDWLAVGSLSGAGGGEEARKTLASPGGPIDPETLAREIDAGWGLSVPLVDGDFNVAGVGTVSFRHGNRLAAFAHPMWGRGVAAMPAAGARINTIVHSIMRPFKVGDSLGQFGVITQDRLPAIGVMVGPTAPMYPLRVTVDDPRYQGQRTLNMRVWMDREQSANYLTVALVESVDAIARASSDASTDIQYNLRFSDGSEVRKSRFITDSMGGMLPVVMMAAEVGAITNNPYKAVQPVEVTVQVRSGYHRAQAEIERIELDRQSYRPGDTVRVTVSLRPWRGEVQTREMSVALPEDLPDGTYQLQVGDSSSRERLEAQLDPGMMRLNSYESLMRFVKRNFAENRIYLTVADRQSGANVDGVVLERLPGSVLATLSATAPAQDFAPIRGNLVIDQDEVTTYEIMGAESKALVVSRKKNP